RGMSDPRGTREGSSVIPLDHRTNLATKVKGETSMFGKAGSREAIKRLARRGPDGMVKADCCLNPSAHSVKNPDWIRWLTSKVSRNASSSPLLARRGKSEWFASHTLPGNRIALSNLKDAKWAPATVLNVTQVRTAGSPKGGDPQGDGASVGVSDGESPSHGEGRQASWVEAC